jgi:hypothetical protein
MTLFDTSLFNCRREALAFNFLRRAMAFTIRKWVRLLNGRCAPPYPHVPGTRGYEHRHAFSERSPEEHCPELHNQKPLEFTRDFLTEAPARTSSDCRAGPRAITTSVILQTNHSP